MHNLAGVQISAQQVIVLLQHNGNAQKTAVASRQDTACIHFANQREKKKTLCESGSLSRDGVIRLSPF